MKKYKLTNQNLQTHKGFQWELGIKKTVSGLPNQLCSQGYLHYYHSPELAVLLNPIHAGFNMPKLFEVKAEGTHLDDHGLKGGCTIMTIIKELKLPEISLIKKITFGILCVKEVYKDERWNEWADNWLNGEDRIIESAHYAIRNVVFNIKHYSSAAHFATLAAVNNSYSSATLAANACEQAATTNVIDLNKIIIKMNYE